MTNTINFIDSVIRNLKPEKTRKVYWCNGCPGFGLRVTPSGTKTFVYKYMSGRQSRWITIGKYPQWSIRKARAEYDKHYEQVHDYGQDPVQKSNEAEARKQDRIKVKDFLETYLETAHLKGKTRIDDERSTFERDILPVIGDKFIDEVTSDDIDDIQRNILKRAKAKNKKNANLAKKGGKSSVRHTLSYARQFFELAKKKKKEIDNNPVDGVESLGTHSVRERILDFKEIWLFWNDIGSTGCPPMMTFALKFLLATMQRSKEVRGIRYSSYKEDERMWHMDIGETKNRRMHRVPLNKYAREQIENAKSYSRDCPYIFGATRASHIPDTPNPELIPFGSSAFSQAINRNRGNLGIDDFSPHDFRRTGATWITAVGLPKLYASLLLNHTDGSSDVTSQVYVQYSYDFEKKRAMDVWEFILDQIVTCKSVDDVPDLEAMRRLVAESGLLHA